MNIVHSHHLYKLGCVGINNLTRHLYLSHYFSSDEDIFILSWDKVSVIQINKKKNKAPIGVIFPTIETLIYGDYHFDFVALFDLDYKDCPETLLDYHPIVSFKQASKVIDWSHSTNITISDELVDYEINYKYCSLNAYFIMALLMQPILKQKEYQLFDLLKEMNIPIPDSLNGITPLYLNFDNSFKLNVSNDVIYIHLLSMNICELALGALVHYYYV